MKNITADNAMHELERVKLRLDVYTDMYNHFKHIHESEFYSEEYKCVAHDLLDAIVAEIDPIDY